MFFILIHTMIHRGYSCFVLYYTGFIYIEWYENKYAISGGSHKWNMIIFITQDDNKFCIYNPENKSHFFDKMA
jgi:hypothetical protein